MRSSDLATAIDPPRIAAQSPAVWLVEEQDSEPWSQLYVATATTAGTTILMIGLLVWRAIAFGV